MGENNNCSAQSWSHRPRLLENTTSSQKNQLQWRLEWWKYQWNHQLDFWSWWSSPCLCREAMKRWCDAIFITSLSSAALFNEHLPHKGSLLSSGYMMADFTMSNRRRSRIIRVTMWLLLILFLLLLKEMAARTLGVRIQGMWRWKGDSERIFHDNYFK